MPITAHKPSSGAWTLILSGMSSGATPANRTEAILEFIVRTVDVPSWMLLKSRMMDDEDPFDVENLAEIVGTLIRKWAPSNREQRRAAAKR